MLKLKKILKTIYLLSLFFLFSPTIYAMEGEGGYAGAYLRIGAGARSLGMGGAFTALSDDATAGYWNAAGLGQIEDHQITCMYSIMSMDRMLNLVTYAQALGEIGSFGISWLNYGVGDIDGRDMTGNPTENFSDSENAFSVSFGKSLSNVLSLSGSLFDPSCPIPLQIGWNLVGCPLGKGYYDTALSPQTAHVPVGTIWEQVAQPVAEHVFGSIAGKYDMIIGEEGAYDPTLPPAFNSLRFIAPGYGYWIKMKEPADLIYP